MNDKDCKTQLIFQELLEKSQNGKIPSGTHKAVAAKYTVSTKTTHRIWQKKRAAEREGKIVDLTDQRKNNGRKKGTVITTRAVRKPTTIKKPEPEMIFPLKAMALLSSVGNITPQGAELAMAAAQEEASANNWKVTICVSDASGIPLQVKRLDAFPASYEISVQKARTAALFQKETALLENAVNVADGISRASLLSAPFVLMGGGVPIMVDGVCCGAIGVSGVTPAQDAQTAKAGVTAFMKSASNSKL